MGSKALRRPDLPFTSRASVRSILLMLQASCLVLIHPLLVAHKIVVPVVLLVVVVILVVRSRLFWPLDLKAAHRIVVIIILWERGRGRERERESWRWWETAKMRFDIIIINILEFWMVVR